MTVKLKWRHLWWLGLAYLMFTTGPDVVRGEWRPDRIEQIGAFICVALLYVELAARP